MTNDAEKFKKSKYQDLDVTRFGQPPVKASIERLNFRGVDLIINLELYQNLLTLLSPTLNDLRFSNFVPQVI